MKKNNINSLSEKDIIYGYLKKLNFNQKESFDFKNDGAFLKKKIGKEIIVTNDSIIESIDFFKNDSAESIAQKIISYNLSDLSSMGAKPYCYTLSLMLPHNVGKIWIINFVRKLLYLQKKYNFFLLGGDIAKSNNIAISANFFGYAKKKFIINRDTSKIGDSIWVTGNIGDSYIGLLVKQNKLKIKNKLHNYFIKKYLFPNPCMIGSYFSHLPNAAIDISDGFLGDLSKLLNNRLGANIFTKNIPFTKNTKYLIKNKFINSSSLLNAGDDYELIFTSSKLNENKIKAIAKKNKFKISKVGRIIENKGMFLDGKKMKNTGNSFEYFF